jgi:CheY-like chemotaxis protein
MSLNGPILCVEDDEDDQYLLGQAFKELDLPNAVHFFAHGQDALDYLSITQEQPFLILCDINMPFLNGLELRQKINEDEYMRKKAIPFVFLTTTASSYTIDKAYQESVQGLYQKATSYRGLYQQLKLIVEYWQNCLHPNSLVG